MSLRTLLGFATLTASLAMTACTTTTPPADAGAGTAPKPGSGKCDAEPVQWAVGQEGNQANMGRVWRESGAGLIRPIGPNQAVTMDYRQDRVNVHLDKDNKITQVTCG
ncbi:I78 family peptidase inhibitor [Pseudoxanthomonas beigongshangi]